MSLQSLKPPNPAIFVAALLLFCLALELTFAGRQQSQTFDEADHILAGYRYWKCRDFAANPEHPPMVKLIASLPLIFQTVKMPIPLCGYANPSSNKDLADGGTFLYSNDADSILFQTRLFASLFTIVLGFVLFESTHRIFGAGPAVIALMVFVFEPNILAHGFLVTTDMGLTCCLYAAIYAFYLYLERRSMPRLMLAGVLVGTSLAAKHSGILVFPILMAVAVADLIIDRMHPATGKHLPLPKQVFTMVASLAAITFIAGVALWAFYAFRFSARPRLDQMPLPALEVSSKPLSKILQAVFQGLLRVHFLPESYLYGLKRVLLRVHGGSPAWILGRIYPTGRWFYFPVVFLVKSTLGFLLLLLAAMLALFLSKSKNKRALSTFIIPPLLFLLFSLPSNLDLGIRHILPVYPFLIVLAGAGAWELRKYGGARYLIFLLVALHAGSSLASFPNYIPYSNEAFGGTKNTYKVLGESNVDWGQSRKAIARYVQAKGIKNCWMSYLTGADLSTYPTPCKLLPTEGWSPADDMIGPRVEGTLLIGASELEAPDNSNPFSQFRKIAPAGNITGAVLMFEGQFDLPSLFALSQIHKARRFLDAGLLNEAVTAARNAVAMAPKAYVSHAELARALFAASQVEESRMEYQSAISLAQSVDAEYNQRDLGQLEEEFQIVQQRSGGGPGSGGSHSSLR